MSLKSCFKHGVCLLVGIMIFGLSSCSKGSDLINVVNDEAVAVIMLQPEQLLNTFDVAVENGQVVIPEDIKSDFTENDIQEMNEMLSYTEGVDRSQVLVSVYMERKKNEYSGRYSNVPQVVVVAKVKDQAALDASFAKLEFEKTSSAGYDVYEYSGSQFVVAEGLVWVVENKANGGELVKELLKKAADNPLADWKVSKLASISDKAVAGLGVIDSSMLEIPLNVNYVMLAGLDLNGATAELKSEVFDIEGKPFDMNQIIKFSHIGDESKFVNDKDLLAFASGENDIIAFVAGMLGNEIGPDLAESLRGLNGVFFGSLNMKKSNIGDFEDFNNYDAILGFGCKPEKVDEIYGMIKELPIAVESDESLKLMLGEYSVNVTKVENNLIVKTDGYEGKDRMRGGALDDYVVWSTCNIDPKTFGVFRQAQISCGVKATSWGTSNSSVLKIEITDTNYNFGHAVASMILSAEKNL